MRKASINPPVGSLQERQAYSEEGEADGDLEIENLYEVTQLVKESEHQIPNGAFARMITFKEREVANYSAQDMMPQSATEAQAFLAYRQGQPKPENGDDSGSNRIDSVVRRRSTIRKFRRENMLVKMKAIDVHDAMLQ